MTNDQAGYGIIDQLPGYIGWKDKNLQHLGCNSNLANLLKLKNSNKIIGLNDADLLGCTEEIYHFHKKNDQLVLTGKTIRCIHKSSSPYSGSFFYFVKKPVIDGNTITGVIYHCNEFIKSNFITNLYDIDKTHCSDDLLPSHYQIGHDSNDLKLSVRELECLFFILRGMTAKQIGEKIKLSTRTIEAYMENIKNKFGCQKKTELLVKAITMGYMNFIPPRFFQNDLITISF